MKNIELKIFLIFTLAQKKIVTTNSHFLNIKLKSIYLHLCLVSTISSLFLFPFSFLSPYRHFSISLPSLVFLSLLGDDFQNHHAKCDFISRLFLLHISRILSTCSYLPSLLLFTMQLLTSSIPLSTRDKGVREEG